MVLRSLVAARQFDEEELKRALGSVPVVSTASGSQVSEFGQLVRKAATELIQSIRDGEPLAIEIRIYMEETFEGELQGSMTNTDKVYAYMGHLAERARNEGKGAVYVSLHKMAEEIPPAMLISSCIQHS